MAYVICEECGVGVGFAYVVWVGVIMVWVGDRVFWMWVVYIVSVWCVLWCVMCD